MKERMHFLALITVSLLAGCATSVAIKDLENDKLGYLRTNFGVNEIPSGTSTVIARTINGVRLH